MNRVASVHETAAKDAAMRQASKSGMKPSSKAPTGAAKDYTPKGKGKMPKKV